MYDACMVYLILGQLVALGLCPNAEGPRRLPIYIVWIGLVPLIWLPSMVIGYAKQRSKRNRQA